MRDRPAAGRPPGGRVRQVGRAARAGADPVLGEAGATTWRTCGRPLTPLDRRGHEGDRGRSTGSAASSRARSSCGRTARAGRTCGTSTARSRRERPSLGGGASLCGRARGGGARPAKGGRRGPEGAGHPEDRGHGGGRGPVRGRLALARALPGAGVVRGRQVRHLHPLGRLLRAGVRQRVVPAQDVPAKARRSSSTTSRPTARRPSSATRTSSRSSRPRSSTRPSWAELFRQARREVRRAGGRAPRRLRHVRQQPHRVERGEDGAEARHRSASWPRRCRDAGGWSSALSSHRAEHWWFFDGGLHVRLRRAGRRSYADLLRPRAATKSAPRTRRAAHRRSSWTTGWRAPASSSTSTDPQLVWFDWWIEQPAFEPYLQRFAAYYYNRGRRVGRGRRDQLQERGLSRDGRRVLDVERGQLAGIRPELLADRHLGREELVGLRRRSRTTRPPARSSTTWSTSSARTARCC